MNKLNVSAFAGAPTWTIRIALEKMREYRKWHSKTFTAYLKDADRFIDFALMEGFEPTLEGIKSHHVDKYIKKAEGKEAYQTTIRVIASLSSVYSFYVDLGSIKDNPFKACKVPLGKVGRHSRSIKFNEIVDIFVAIQQIKDNEGKDLSVTIEVLFFTGLRNHELTSLKVKNIILIRG